ncbi:hypothetical protein PV05_09313 [Exophiala xenobiotica]|uniref:DUF3431 domain-containing protein n=1 Tax=Exophiala xenobiotica TaxID=348802 RepID=A0A0D2ERW5_9EURO|nr:uncharacterized protein PV05_09313 [Exophiala xenobiotica]KIW50509.1 hypothetical protein PV05_09313 [Exophiala xenobiotica]
MLLRKSTALSLALGAFTLIYLVTNLSSKPKYIYGQNDPSSLYNPSLFTPGISRPAGHNYTRILVMGRLHTEDVSWVSRDLPDLPTKIYTVDSDMSGLPANKGHEAMVYLTYIIDHYDSVPDVVLFFHPHKTAWHNNILLDIDSAKTIKLLSDPHVIRQGYFNTRCHLDPGCPNWLHIDRPRWRHDLKHKPEEPALTSQLFHELHGANVPLPSAISQPCCAQFAVSGDRIRQRPREDYVRYRTWLLSTELDDKTSGRLMEYSWQYIFTGNFEFCPSQHKCYCDGYGLCFQGEDGLRNWLSTLKQKERLDEKLAEMWDTGVKGGEKYKRLAWEIKQKAELLDQLREEAIRRGFDPKIRATECGREWHEGDGF